MIARDDSAGANLAAMLGTTGASRQFDDTALGNSDQSSAVRVASAPQQPRKKPSKH